MSSKEHEDHGYLLEVIPPFFCEPWQVPRWNHGRDSPTYRLQRKPINLHELNRYGYGIAIWRDNGTLTYVTPCGSDDHPDDDLRCLSLVYFCRGPTLNITGLTDKAVAETAAYFMNLETPTKHSSCLLVGTDHFDGYDFCAARVQCLQHIVEVAPSRAVKFQNVTLSAPQSAFLATRTHTTRLTLCRCQFEDEGTAFVDALENRKSSFGRLDFGDKVALNDENLKRLLQIEMIDHLGLPELKDELALLPFSTKAKYLDYDFSSASSLLSEANLKSLHIVPSKLAFTIKEDGDAFPTEVALSFLRRLADIGHFEELKVKFTFDDIQLEVDLPDCIVDEIIRTALANPKLQVLNLSTDDDQVEWDSHLETVFQGLKDHKGLRALTVDVDDDAFGPDYSHLQKFLSDHRNITVMDENDNIYSDDEGVIDELYSLNRFYSGSASLVVKPLSERTSLVSTALMEMASNDFQRSALLLSNHTDALYELVQYAQLDELLEENEVASSSIQGNVQKRRRRV